MLAGNGSGSGSARRRPRGHRDRIPEEETMDRFLNELWHIPPRFSPNAARLQIGVALFDLALAALGLVIYEGAQRVAYVAAIGAIALGNLTWGVGSLLPEEQGGRQSRGMARPCFLLMLFALPIAFALEIAHWR
jgi:hypothetical protein